MGAEASRRHGPRCCFLLLWPGRYARPHHLRQRAIPTHGNYFTPETLYRVGSTTFNLGLLFLIALPLQLTVLHIAERAAAQMETTSQPQDGGTLWAVV